MVSKLTTKPKIAVVAGLARELKFLEEFQNIRIFQGYSKNALIAARNALSERPDVIISFGLAGSINPKVQNSKIIIPKNIIDKFGNKKKVSKKYSDFFNKRISDKVFSQNLITVDKIEHNLNNKKYLNKNISFIDMESSYIQQEAIKKKIPFISMRVIFDDLNFSIPQFLKKCIDRNGNLILFKLIINIILSPKRILELIELSKKYKKASIVLKKISNEAFRNF
tara:strand:+ start:510 stop:1181 length:672 start_codon:yes stop_codon:yes gene_type:complete